MTIDRGDPLMICTRLPAFHRAGDPGTWEVTDQYGSTALLEGHFLGMGSSHRPSHKHPFPPYAAPGEHCSTCRWREIRIFQETDHGRYLVVQRGMSIVPDESARITFGWADTADAVVETLVSWNEQGQPFFSFIARRALEQAAQYDERIRSVYRAADRQVGS